MDDQSFFSNLPSELILNILCRLPIKTITCCKCLNRSWLKLLQSSEFVNSHLSKSLPAILTYQHYRAHLDYESIKICELVDELELGSHELHYSPVTEFDINEFFSPSHTSMGVDGSVDGLLFLHQIHPQPEAFYVCNPITREYIVLPEIGDVFYYPSTVTYGFGISKMSGQYKVVRIFHQCARDPDTYTLSIPKAECKVYILGTGTWKSIANDSSHEYSCHAGGTFVNGNLHWLVTDLDDNLFISCLDLETEQFGVFSPPAGLGGRSSLTTLENRMCVCDNTSETEIVIWIMNEYEVEKSWNIISKIPNIDGEFYEVIYPLKVFKDGDILMWWPDTHLFYYSNRTKSTEIVESFGPHRFIHMQAILHVPSFVSLSSFVIENVKSF